MYLKYHRHIIVRTILYPFTILYYLLISLRNKLFDYGLLPVKKFAIPVVSVGNITAGGSGKTPFIVFLSGLLGQKFNKIAIISRGYHRKSRGLVIVSDGQGNINTVHKSGDEPVLIAKKCKECVVIACEKRVRGAIKAIDDFACDLILLDDAFQHRWIDRDCDILLINTKEPISRDHLLPAGNLREPCSQIKRSDMVIFTHAEDNQNNKDLELIQKTYSGSVFYSYYTPEYYQDIRSGEKWPLDYLKNKPVMAFCGIAKPQLFKDTLLKLGVNLKDVIVFSDHHDYTSHDLVKMTVKAEELNCQVLITTEKDMTKLVSFEKVTHLVLVGLIMKIGVKDEMRIYQKIKECIDKKLKNG